METLKNLEIGKSAVISKVGGTGALRQHFLDMGMIPGVKVTMMKHAPMGDPLEIRVFNYELTLRKEEAAQIEIEEGAPPPQGHRGHRRYPLPHDRRVRCGQDRLLPLPKLGICLRQRHEFLRQ